MNRIALALMLIAAALAAAFELAAVRTAARARDNATLLAAVRAGSIDPVGQLQRAVAETGLSEFTRSTPDAPVGTLRLLVENAPFDTLVALLARLQERERLRPVAVRIDAATASGRVDATLDFPAPSS